jgi:hypothetical protein
LVVDLYDALFNVGYRVVLFYLVMYYGDKVVDHLSGVYPVHIVAYDVPLSHDFFYLH